MINALREVIDTFVVGFCLFVFLFLASLAISAPVVLMMLVVKFVDGSL